MLLLLNSQVAGLRKIDLTTLQNRNLQQKIIFAKPKGKMHKKVSIKAIKNYCFTYECF